MVEREHENIKNTTIFLCALIHLNVRHDALELVDAILDIGHARLAVLGRVVGVPRRHVEELVVAHVARHM